MLYICVSVPANIKNAVYHCSVPANIIYIYIYILYIYIYIYIIAVYLCNLPADMCMIYIRRRVVEFDKRCACPVLCVQTDTQPQTQAQTQTHAQAQTQTHISPGVCDGTTTTLTQRRSAGTVPEVTCSLINTRPPSLHLSNSATRINPSGCARERG